MKKMFLCSLFSLVLISCQESALVNNGSGQSIYREIDEINFYLNLMKNREFSLELIGDCEDALDDTIHELYECVVESEEQSDSIMIINFKFIAECCQQFMGNYSTNEDTLLFKFVNVTNDMCMCLCWYSYRLKISGLTVKINNVIIRRV